jgi:hypothetical protein
MHTHCVPPIECMRSTGCCSAFTPHACMDPHAMSWPRMLLTCYML